MITYEDECVDALLDQDVWEVRVRIVMYRIYTETSAMERLKNFTNMKDKKFAKSVY